ncbi:uncharacterized protein BDR25DRAFT_363940 [Lindgomyces ingoldianus]|uniref:Uncharacterized protein n=2 Tax=Lindgomyces ingoldianus TaxID=673940 RepID=A0ACB6Q6M4_9PLEO|nr:uncharacterized protein BDR25DRAFT_364021 [Lindgomyces ingoldianus]XP_033539392.1 uncharacterized protein BDR25DRAFT_363940 [Lindgomyces ingoldianus]KAF2462504.1 hypothetical protein BDR25DRAFT_364021 [Lindgomyces ingoldianus]KAF2462547.1 hypothetical protein BDR25DRAFT_363940 [Lindgomyces ingoldianus]
MDKVRAGCAICWVLDNLGPDKWRTHKTMKCIAQAGSEVLRYRQGRYSKVSIAKCSSTAVGIIRQCGYCGKLGGDWREYAAWLGKRHRYQV